MRFLLYLALGFQIKREREIQKLCVWPLLCAACRLSCAASRMREPAARPGLLVSVEPSACDSQSSFTTTNDQFTPLMTPEDGLPAQQAGLLVQHPQSVCFLYLNI